jgi:undecaprenyl-phosphate 4-deoxy-4-formamido-L-arabinose transferase
VIPIYNEEAGLAALFARFYPALDTLGRSYELVLIDDGSRDRFPAHQLVDFAQHMVTLAGFERAHGAILVTLDADLQNPSGELGKLLDKMDQGYDHVGSHCGERRDSALRRVASPAINRLRERLARVRMAVAAAPEKRD